MEFYSIIKRISEIVERERVADSSQREDERQQREERGIQSVEPEGVPASPPPAVFDDQKNTQKRSNFKWVPQCKHPAHKHSREPPALLEDEHQRDGDNCVAAVPRPQRLHCEDRKREDDQVARELLATVVPF